MAKKIRYNAVIFLYIVVLILFGVTLWLYRENGRRTPMDTSARFDSSLTQLFLENGIISRNIIGRKVAEKTSGNERWHEISEEIQLPPGIDETALFAALRTFAGENRYEISQSEDGRRHFVEIGQGRRILARLSFIRSTLPGSDVPSKKVALVIDDLGYTNDISSFLELGVPITFAILPHERHSREIAQKLTELGMPYILHLPLEPEGYPGVDPGKSALLVKMSEGDIVKKFASDCRSVPGVAGISNHMGSRFSADEEKMRILLQLVKNENLFYFDSCTTPKSKAKKVAKTLGVPCRVNELFVDLKDDPEFMSRQMDELIRKADRYGEAIAIGHVQKKYLAQVVKDYIPKFKERGIEFVYLPEMYRSKESRAPVVKADLK